ncbi:MAG: DUF4398 domain-containing protein [Kofleriaceae bacterium]|nr:DUF4398 domain-containing protein [Kofleriaceae bacterium]
MARGWLLAIVLAAGACGPIVYVSEVTRRASTAVDDAKAVQADKYAPYYWTRAIQYLHQAKELAAHADFQGANRFGRLAAEAAEIAVTEAQLAAKDPSRRPLVLDRASTVEPAQDGAAPAKEAQP